jgi:lipopolysaccharide export system protein LptA
VIATFGDRQVLNTIVGAGRASLEQTADSGTRQITSGDRIEAALASTTGHAVKKAPSGPDSLSEQIQSAIVEGHVVLVQQPAIKPGSPSQAPLRATAGRAVYEADGEWLHLLVHPRVESGALQLTADKLDFSQGSGDAFAHGNVKATWSGEAPSHANPSPAVSVSAPTLGGQGPAHVVAAEAQLRQSTGEATFHGQARLWQQTNSVSAPIIVLDRIRQTLVARSTGAADPVRVVMLSAGALNGAKSGPQPAPGGSPGNRASPTVIRVRAGDLKYSEAERKAVLHGATAGNVIAETGTATVVSSDLELLLLPPGNHAGPNGSAAQVDRVTASGHVVVTSQGRRGAGDRLVYSSESGQYVLTGTLSDPPRLTDSAKGTVTGTSLIFNSHDDSVSIEGGGRKTSTEAVAPK